MNELPTWRIWPVLLIAFALQTSWLARVQIGGAHLDLPLLVVISVALILGWRWGSVVGLAAGLVTGYVVAKNPGSFAFSRLFVGAILGLADRSAASDNPLAPPILAALGTLLADGLVWLMAPTDFSVSWWLHHTPIRMALHALLIWPLHWVLSRWLKPSSKLMFG